MIKEIVTDFLTGHWNAINIGPFVVMLINQSPMFNITMKIIFVYLWSLLLPYGLGIIGSLIFGSSALHLMHVISNILSIVGTVLNTMNYIDLINVISGNSINRKFRKRSGELSGSSNFDNFSMGVSMTIYQLTIQLTIILINYLLGNHIYISHGLKYLLLCTYYSLYCHNNLWQYLQLDMVRRIDIHEKRWAYYLGYGNILTVFHLLSSNPLISFGHGLCTIIMLSNPFLINAVFPKKESSYPKINLTIVSWIMNILVGGIKMITGIKFM